MDVPLVSTFVLASKKGKEAYVQPIVEGDEYRFTVVMGQPPEAEQGTKVNGRGANFRCIISDSAIGGDYIKSEAMAGRMGTKLMAVVTEGARSRIYLSPTIRNGGDRSTSRSHLGSPTWNSFSRRWAFVSETTG